MCSQASNVIVTIASLLPTDWTCCRLYEWQIWGRQDRICRLSLWRWLFANFVSFFSNIILHSSVLPPFAHCYHLLCELTEAYSLILLTTNPTVTTEGLTSEVQAKAGSSVELECRLPSSDPAVVSSASQHVVEWIRQGFDIPVLIKFGSYAPRVHPQYEGKHLLLHAYTVCYSWCHCLK